jgi:hypothetical protein
MAKVLEEYFGAVVAIFARSVFSESVGRHERLSERVSSVAKREQLEAALDYCRAAGGGLERLAALFRVLRHLS